jgi:hypothetical protein
MTVRPVTATKFAFEVHWASLVDLKCSGCYQCPMCLICSNSTFGINLILHLLKDYSTKKIVFCLSC